MWNEWHGQKIISQSSNEISSCQIPSRTEAIDWQARPALEAFPRPVVASQQLVAKMRAGLNRHAAGYNPLCYRCHRQTGRWLVRCLRSYFSPRLHCIFLENALKPSGGGVFSKFFIDNALIVFFNLLQVLGWNYLTIIRNGGILWFIRLILLRPQILKQLQ